MELKVEIRRDVGSRSCQFTDIFEGFDKVGAVRSLFGRRSMKVLQTTRVRLVKSDGYLRVDNDTGDIIICSPYLKTGEERHIYLDLIHELCHVKQHHEGKELYDRTYPYVDRPTEVEAYALAVKEARRIGMSEKEIAEYLLVEWVSALDFRRMLRNLGVKDSKGR